MWVIALLKSEFANLKESAFEARQDESQVTCRSEAEHQSDSFPEQAISAF
jgi:hypothetical protein